MGKKSVIFAGAMVAAIAISTAAGSMKKSRKPLLAGAVALALTLGASACAASPNSGKTEQLTILTGDGLATPRGKSLTSMAKEFTKSTGIKVKVLAGGANTKSFYEASVLAHKEADIVLANLDAESTSWLKIKAAIPVTQYMKAWGLTKVIPEQAVKDWTTNGQLQAFPYLAFQWPVMYNKALLEKAGVNTIPATTDDLIAAAAKLRAIGVAPLAIGGNDYSGEKLFFQVLQNYLPQDQAQKLFETGGYCQNQQAMKGIDLFVKLRDAGVFVDNAQGLSADNMSALYDAGKAAMEPQGSWGFVTVPQDIAKSTVLAGLPVPSDAVFSKPTAYQGTIGQGIWVSPNGSKKLAAVEKLVKFLFSPAIAASWPAQTGDLVNANLSDADLAKAPQLLRDAMKLPTIVDYAVLPDAYLPAKVGTAINPVTSQAFTSGTSSKQICGALDQVYS
ncbi:MAG: ABC transporter substrate-binding protein [Lacisediminihabitans sp.]